MAASHAQLKVDYCLVNPARYRQACCKASATSTCFSLSAEQPLNFRSFTTRAQNEQPDVPADHFLGPAGFEEGGLGSLINYNPLSNMSSAEVWNFLHVKGVPTNKLHECGYISISREPCTQPVLPNQHEREGRWWWEDSTAKECGLHSGNIKKADGSTEERKAERDLWIDGSAVATLDKAAVEKLASGTRDKDTLLVLYVPWCPFCQALEPNFEAVAQQLAGSHVTVGCD